jgi:D-3-phosphoglycerate dehydrogenase / 2-oxoglutarate reductase
VEPTQHLLFVTYRDRPGMVGAVGRVLGDADINIASMQVSRQRPGGDALVTMAVDSGIPAPVAEQIRTEMRARLVRIVDLEF